MPRNIATSPVVHLSRGSGSAMVARLQRLRCLIPACAFGPDHGDRDAGPFRLGHVARRLSVSPQRGTARAAPRGKPAAKGIKHGSCHLKIERKTVMAGVDVEVVIDCPQEKVFDLVTTAELWPQWAVLAWAMAGVTERRFQLGDPHSRVRPHPDRRAGNRVAHHRARPAPPRQVAGRGRLARGGRGRAALPPGGGDAAPADALPVPDASDLDLAQVRASAARATASATASRSMSPLRRPAVVVGT